MNIICFGDSNTYGYDPRSCLGEQYPASVRWVDLISCTTGWALQNDGVNGQRIPTGKPDLTASADLLILMLGTNDLLQGCTAAETGLRMDQFLSCLSLPGNNVLLIAPPPMKRGAWVPDDHLIRESLHLAEIYESLSIHHATRFLNAGNWNISLAFDGVHFTEAGHKAFADQLCQYFEKEFS